MKVRIFCISLMLSMVSATVLAAATPSIIPRPQSLTTMQGTFTLCPGQVIPGVAVDAAVKILTDTNSFETGQYLAGMLLKSTGYRFQVSISPLATNALKRCIVLTTFNGSTNLGPEGYQLTVAPDSVLIRSMAPAGVFYGVQSFFQLLPPEILASTPTPGIEWIAPCVVIQDAPRFIWRGWMLDSVRHFFNKDEVKKLIDAMALHKLNRFHWHLDDDSGWRIEILGLPRLTDVSAWRTDIMFGLNNKSTTAFDDNERYGGYYTQADVREIVAYASQRHITVVPEIEMPGHSTGALTAYPEFSCNGTNVDCPTCLNVPHSLNVTAYSGGVFCPARVFNPIASNNIGFPFLTNILTQVMGLFTNPSPTYTNMIAGGSGPFNAGNFIHIGGDEVSFGNWNKHLLDQSIMTNTLGLTNIPGGPSAQQQYQSWFTQNIANWVRTKGWTMMGWSEIMNGGTVTNAGLMDWIDGSGSRSTQAATNGEPCVMTSSAELYLNKWQTGTSAGLGGGVIWSNEPPGQSGFVPLSTVYNFEPVNAFLTVDTNGYATNIIGIQGNSWAEYIPSLKNMEFKTYPRLCAVAESGWTSKSLKSLSNFNNRLAVHKLRLTQMGINFNPEATPPTAGTWTAGQISTNFTQLVWDITSKITSAGEVDLSFCWKSGANGLLISWAALEENGVELDRDTHDGVAQSGTQSRVQYALRLRSLRPGATYTIRASVAGNGGTASNGTVYLPLWD